MHDPRPTDQHCYDCRIEMGLPRLDHIEPQDICIDHMAERFEAEKRQVDLLRAELERIEARHKAELAESEKRIEARHEIVVDKMQYAFEHAVMDKLDAIVERDALKATISERSDAAPDYPLTEAWLERDALKAEVERLRAALQTIADRQVRSMESTLMLCYELSDIARAALAWSDEGKGDIDGHK